MGAKTIAQNVVTPSRWLAMFTATTLVLVFLLLCVVLYLEVRVGHVSDSVWSKYIKIFEGLGPLVGLAVGWVFGKEVHRKEAENANSRADGAKRDAIRGHQLAAVVRSMKTQAEMTDGAGDGAASSLQTVIAEANKLFPALENDPDLPSA